MVFREKPAAGRRHPASIAEMMSSVGRRSRSSRIRLAYSKTERAAGLRNGSRRKASVPDRRPPSKTRGRRSKSARPPTPRVRRRPPRERPGCGRASGWGARGRPPPRSPARRVRGLGRARCPRAPAPILRRWRWTSGKSRPRPAGGAGRARRRRTPSSCGGRPARRRRVPRAGCRGRRRSRAASNWPGRHARAG